jgi:hypothetical protein
MPRLNILQGLLYIDLVEDETSKKNMPNMLSFTGGDRFFGSLAKSLVGRIWHI